MKKYTGSSPLARGLPPRPTAPGSSGGIIPARAGFTPLERELEPGERDHPRSRGVYPRGRGGRAGARGSSPLARGLRRWNVNLNPVKGIIPARAGFTHAAEAGEQEHGDHPRSRGVYAVDQHAVHRASGSSPLARGLPAEFEVHRVHTGIIPARAGFTMAMNVYLPVHGDHPRSRGVYRPVRLLLDALEGSSPLARGLR